VHKFSISNRYVNCFFPKQYKHISHFDFGHFRSNHGSFQTLPLGFSTSQSLLFLHVHPSILLGFSKRNNCICPNEKEISPNFIHHFYLFSWWCTLCFVGGTLLFSKTPTRFWSRSGSNTFLRICSIIRLQPVFIRWTNEFGGNPHGLQRYFRYPPTSS